MNPRNRRALWVLGIALAVHFLLQWRSSRYSHPSRVREVVLDLRSSDESRRLEAQFALAEMGTNAVPNLWRLYTTTNALSWKTRIARWLGPRSPFRREDEHKERRIGYEGLKALGPEAVSVSSNLVVELENDFKQVGYVSSLLMSFGPKALPAIVPALSTSSPQTKEHLLYVIGHYGPSASSAVVDVAAALHGPHDRVRRAAAATLARIQGLPFLSVPALTTLLGDSNAETREVALHSLTAFGPGADAALDRVRQLVSTTSLDGSERLAAVGLLLAMKQHSLARPQVLRLLESSNPTNRVWALTNLAEALFTWPEVGSNAARLLSDPEADVQAHCAMVLGRATREAGYPEDFISAGLGAELVDTRLAFLKAAWQVDAAILPMSVRALADADARVCQAAAMGLVGLPFSTKPAQPALASVLNHTNGSVRSAAYHALHNSDSKLFPALFPWPLHTPTEKTINALVRLHLLGSAAVADTNQLPAEAGGLPQQFGPLLGAITATGRANLIPSLKSMLSKDQDYMPQGAAITLVELSSSHEEAMSTVLQLLRSGTTPPSSVVALRMALGFRASSAMRIWWELAESSGPDLRREALLHIAGTRFPKEERSIPLLLNAVGDSDLRVRELATNLLRYFPNELVDRYRTVPTTKNP